MGMTEDTDVRSRAIEKRPSLFGQLPGLKHHMPNCNTETIQLDDTLCRKAALFVFVDIARDSRHRCDCLQLLYD